MQVAVLACDNHGVVAECGGQLLGVGDADQDAGGMRHRIQHRVDRPLGDQPAGGDDDQVVGKLLHLGKEMAGDQHGAAVGGEGFEQVAHPADTVGVQAVGRLVEDQDPRVADQCRGDPQPLPHAQ